VTTLHGTDITVLGHDSSLSDAIRFGIEKSDAVTAVSNALVAQTYDVINPDKKIHCVHNFIDQRVYQSQQSNLREEYKILPGEKVIIHVSNFRPVKRVPDVVRAFAKVSAKLPAKLVLVGDGPEMKVVSNLVNKLGLREKVLFLGKQENLAELYSISDLMLLLSEKESFGLAALEAMSCGVPCIGTDVGGIPELITDGENGYICTLGDIDEIAAKAVALLSQSHQYEEFSRNAVRAAKEKFGAKKIVEEYEAIYGQVLGQVGE
jgi:N-acetyl-alpha-D-glucosaminyl L-malate synthase BshA